MGREAHGSCFLGLSITFIIPSFFSLVLPMSLVDLDYEAARLERARLRKERQREREEKIKAIVAADEQDKINGTGRWDYSQVRKNQWVALALAISLGLCGAQYFYMGKKFLGWCLCGLVVCSFFFLLLIIINNYSDLLVGGLRH